METILWSYESDNYTTRAFKNDDIYNSEDQKRFVLRLFNNLGFAPKNLLDIGCSYGETLYHISKQNKDINLFGIDPGGKSIEITKGKVKNGNFVKGYSHELPFNDFSMDVVILNMVFQWIPRKYLLKTIAEIDRVLNYGGVIFFQDFLPFSPVSSVSRHNSDVFIFKDDYSKIFTSVAWFKEIFRKVDYLEEGEDFQKITCMIKKHRIEDSFINKEDPIKHKHI